MNTKELIAPCGLACFACAIYTDNISEDLKEMLAADLGMKSEDIACKGCRSDKGCSVSNVLSQGKGCPTKVCVADKALHNCSECEEFPCDKLMPVAQRAEGLPHNTKVYNLSRIKLIGMEAFAKEAPLIQQKYFKGKFVYGDTPKLD